jgi:hypothetical protein
LVDLSSIEGITQESCDFSRGRFKKYSEEYNQLMEGVR